MSANRKDVRHGNVVLVQSQLDKISEARTKFRSAVREYRRMFATYHSQNCSTVQAQLDDKNQQVRIHADHVWAKVEQLQSQQQYQASVLPLAQSQTSTAPPAQTSSPGDLLYKKRVFQDQLLYLREALSLPASGSIEEHWKEKSETDISQAI